jgi:hypothetical protein
MTAADVEKKARATATGGSDLDPERITVLVRGAERRI